MGRQHRQGQLGLDALLAGKLDREAGAVSIVRNRGAVAGQELRLTLEAARQARARSGERLDRLAARLALAEADIAAGAQHLDDGTGRREVLEDGIHILEEPGAIERLEAKSNEVLVIGRSRRRGRSGEQQAPPELVDGRRARRQLEAGQQPLQRFQVEPAPQLERQAATYPAP